ncbi:AarF/UbiB family protein [Evansella sp. AB-P1]|uniref:ABC1 kinase family protein n=1 Tax=Evansella sp. AB-P1 TaxID=3037653 RepID=UPI00241F9D42|nr:AarF/UbiB family protein [Evansella sp. AB-P1]MDG5786345.1 AarF/UbiB family protein [Evansella sp. AB-P1]
MKQLSLYRITVIVSMFIKFIFQVYMFNKKNKNWDTTTYEAWENLLRKQAEEYRIKAIKLQGLLIKVGQFLSTRADIFPQAFLEELTDLIDQVPPVPVEVSKRILKKEWNREIDDILLNLSNKPVASASIGEVYKGTLHNGQEVAIKIQRHDIDKIIKKDFKALRIVLWIAKKFTTIGKKADLSALYKEMVITISDELNYEKELKNGQYFQSRFQENKKIYIPQFYEEYSTKRVLVMEWINGAKITDIPYLTKHHIDREKVGKELFDFFVEQLLDYGTFHADPHQGNILITKTGTIVLIDFGMIGFVDRHDTLMLRQMIQGFVLKDYQLIIKQLEELGFLLPHANKRQLQTILKHGVEAYLDESLIALDQALIERIFDDLQDLVRNQPIQLPAEYAFLGRAASIALGVLTIVDPKIDFIELGKPVVQKWLNESNGEQEKSFQYDLLKDAAKPLLHVPKNLNQWLEAPKQQLEQSERQQWNSYEQARKLLVTVFSFITFIISFILLFISIWLNHTFLIYLSLGSTIISILLIIIFTASHSRWVKNNHR